MSGLTYIDRSINPPVGSINQYYGTSDPDGWIICDGVTRTSTDNRYARLATLLNTMQGISTNNSNSVTPPNLKSKFLYGSSNITTGLGVTGGSNTITLTNSNLPAHSHTGTTGDNDVNHTHTYIGLPSTETSAATNGGHYRIDNTTGRVQTADNNSDHTHPLGTSSSTGEGAAFSILPPYFIINHIIKY
jgi:microcystin-dependent protein